MLINNIEMHHCSIRGGGAFYELLAYNWVESDNAKS